MIKVGASAEAKIDSIDIYFEVLKNYLGKSKVS